MPLLRHLLKILKDGNSKFSPATNLSASLSASGENSDEYFSVHFSIMPDGETRAMNRSCCLAN